MVFYDLTKTSVATSARPIRPPSDLELFAITVGLLMVADRGFGELASASLELTDRRCRRVAEVLEERAPSLARELGGPALLRARLKQLVGLQIYREFQ